MTPVDIANLALSYLGDTATVASISPPEGSAQAQHCARFYPMAVAQTLEGHDWNFITERSALAVLTTPYSDRWLYAYAPPADLNTMISVVPSIDYNALDPTLYLGYSDWTYWPDWFPCELMWERLKNFEIEVDSLGRNVLLSNLENAIGRYTVNTASESNFPAIFTECVTRRLASMLAGPLIKGSEGRAESKAQMQMAMLAESKAKVQDANQKHDQHRPVPIWIRDR